MAFKYLKGTDSRKYFELRIDIYIFSVIHILETINVLCFIEVITVVGILGSYSVFTNEGSTLDRRTYSCCSNVLLKYKYV